MAGKSRKVLIVNNGTQYMKELRGKVSEHAGKAADVETVNIKDVKSKDVSGYDAVVLSGSSKRRYDDPNLGYVLDNAEGAVIGICHGHQAMVNHYGGSVEDMGTYQRGYKTIKTRSGGEAQVFKNHRYAATRAGSLEVLAESDVKDSQGKNRKIIEAVKHPNKPHYGIQGHPEKGGHAEQMLYNILNRVYRKKEAYQQRTA
ncbi:hypothetical protein KY360_05895 [Candidatus Woesearchaeota archaeon]|nr:hypothetical protein [Candidatus Woesearchaeota archaeon]